MRNLISFCLVTCFLIAFNEVYAQPSSYDLRNFGLVTPIKDQGSCGACWAFATCAAIESQWLKAGGSAVDLSEDNLTDCHGFDETPCLGGSFYMSQAMLSMHKGIFSEAIDPYTTSTLDCPNSLTFPPTPLAYVEDMLFIPSTVADVKNALMTYGAVASTMYFTGANYNSTTFKYYDSSIDAIDLPNAHCVTIVGWDDNLTFPGAPGNGGWIIKDSYGTLWANNGYFYCSFFDAGILTENAVFPVKQNIPVSGNESHVYAHDEFGWVDNYGYSNPTAFALTKYTITPAGGSFSHQQIQRIGTYAVEDNTTINLEVYRSKNGNQLTELLTSTTINCAYKGFYTVPVYLKTDTINSSFYVKATYSCPGGTQNPIPIEKYEASHTSAFSASTNQCWISPDGNNWTAIGGGTAFNFDACIKVYTESAPYAYFTGLNDSLCQNANYTLFDQSTTFTDSIKWFENGVYIGNSNTFNYIPSSTGSHNVSLVAFLGDNSDTMSFDFTVYPSPSQPTITQNVNTLTSSSANSYQWLDNSMAPIIGANSQSYSPPLEDIYYVEVTNQYGCSSISNPFNFFFAGLDEIASETFSIYPNPTNGTFFIKQINNSGKLILTIRNLEGRIVKTLETADKLVEINIDGKKGVYIMEINKNGIIFSELIIKI